MHMDAEKVRNYFERLNVVCDYARAVEGVGLWESEKKIFCGRIGRDSEILELGCGAGRIAHGLFRLGYKRITATDFSSNMIDVARAVARELGDSVDYRVEDARSLSFPDGSFDAAIFGFNGLMQIPGRSQRRRAMSEAHRVLRGGGVFIFTTHDRDLPSNCAYWERERALWERGGRNPDLDEFGDRVYGDGSGGNIYIHSPVLSDVEADLRAAGFCVCFRARRSEIAAEPARVREFSDDCVFWVAEKPMIIS